MNRFWQSQRRRLVPALLFGSLLLLAALFHQRLFQWFGVLTPAAQQVASSSSGASPAAAAPQPVDKSGDPERNPVALPPLELSAAARTSVQALLSVYEEVRARLANDASDGIAPRATRMQHMFHALAQSLDGHAQAKAEMQRGAEAAKRLSQAGELESQREEFGQVSRALVLLLGADPEAAKDHHLFSCPMKRGFNKWVQASEELANPYMGQKMLKCGSEADWPGGEAIESLEDHAAHIPGGEAVHHYTCPMHPSVNQPGPGKCPICGMDLVAVTKAEVETGVVFVDAERRQLIGVKTALVRTKELSKLIRTVGKITYDETRIVDVTLKFKGWIGKLYANASGIRVKKGHTLFSVYSPEVYQAQQDLLIASASGGDGGGPLLDAARRRLELWDVPRGTVEQVLKSKKPIRYVPISSPASGYVVEKNVFDGSAVDPGMRLLRIANLDKVWIEAELYEAELPLVSQGQKVEVSLPYLPDKSFEGKVTFIYPYLNSATRTGRVRVELENKKVELKPDMYANVELQVARGERLVVPESAVIYAGPRRLVFVDLGEGKLRPQEVKVGIKLGDDYEVLSGLRRGQKVVTSGNFLIAAESRLKSATGQW